MDGQIETNFFEQQYLYSQFNYFKNSNIEYETGQTDRTDILCNTETLINCNTANDLFAIN